jgi:hypothetical protein
MFDGVIGFCQLCPTDDTFEERIYIRRDVPKSLGVLTKMFNVYIVFPAEFKHSMILAFIEGLSNDILKKLSIYQIQHFKR